MRYTAMMWYRRANDAALGGGADITPDEPIDDDDRRSEREEWAEMHGYERYRCPTCHRSFHSDSGPHCPYHEDTDPLSDESYERENNV